MLFGKNKSNVQAMFDKRVTRFPELPGMKTVAYCDVEASRADAFLSIYGGEYATVDSQRIFADPTLDGVMIQTGVYGGIRF